MAFFRRPHPDVREERPFEYYKHCHNTEPVDDRAAISPNARVAEIFYKGEGDRFVRINGPSIYRLEHGFVCPTEPN